jgi:MinD superfamily P-loop ATPase
MVLAIASGKGGTGKTTVAVNLARVHGSSLQLLDCDVEEPNTNLFLKGVVQEQRTVSLPVPQVNESLCDGCGECSHFCQFNAIVSLGSKPLVFPELCHGCGGCAQICPQQAISEEDRRIGVVEILESNPVTLVQGRLDIGAPMSPPLIKAVKSQRRRELPAILDAPAGTSCPVITALKNTDFVVLVSEPTPFGLHDLELAVEVVRALSIPFGVVVNRVGIGDDRVHSFCSQQGISVLLEIPHDRRIAEACSKGELLVEALPEYYQAFENLLERTFALRESSGQQAHSEKRACEHGA